MLAGQNDGQHCTRNIVGSQIWTYVSGFKQVFNIEQLCDFLGIGHLTLHGLSVLALP